MEYFTPANYMNLGKNVLVSILDVFEKNPYSRIPSTPQRTLEQIRKEVAQECARYDRFRADPVAFKKVRVIQEYIYENFFQPLQRRGLFKMDGELLAVKWPENFIPAFKRYQPQEKSQSPTKQVNKRKIFAGGVRGDLQQQPHQQQPHHQQPHQQQQPPLSVFGQDTYDIQQQLVMEDYYNKQIQESNLKNQPVSIVNLNSQRSRPESYKDVIALSPLKRSSAQKPA